MAMNMQCPECGHEFEIEESQQAQDNQAKALKAQKIQLKAEYEKEKDTEVEKKLKNAGREHRIIREKDVDEERNKKTAGFAERDLIITRLINKIKDLKEDATRSQEPEIKGQAAEDVLKNNLKKRFPGDRIEDISKGKSGADFKHYVCVSSNDGPPVVKGMILIECKSTKSFQKI